jgi:rhodanese-related sulfurtransferase
MKYHRRTRKLNKMPVSRRPLFPFLRKPAGQLTVVLIVALIVFLIAISAGKGGLGSTREVSVDDAYKMFQNGTYVLDVSWPAEWEEYHAPNTKLIPLDQLYNRLDEVPKDRQVLVVSRSQKTSQEACDLLLSAKVNAVSMAGSMSEWYAKGYPIEGAPPQ